MKRIPGAPEDCGKCAGVDEDGDEESCKGCAEVLQPEKFENSEEKSHIDPARHHRHQQQALAMLPECPCPKKRSNCLCVDVREIISPTYYQNNSEPISTERH